MKITSQKNYLSFQKKLIAKAGIVKNGEPAPCEIYRLDKKRDYSYFQNLCNSSDWDGSYFLKNFKRDFVNGNKDYSFYAVEDGTHSCLGLMELKDGIFNKKSVILLESCPKYAYSLENSENRGIKYIGETLLAFASMLGKRSLCPELKIPLVSPMATIFYRDNCGFKSVDGEFLAYKLERPEFDSLIMQNKEHTGYKIRF